MLAISPVHTLISETSAVLSALINVQTQRQNSNTF